MTNPFNLITEFITPTDDPLYLITLGDNINQLTKTNLNNAIIDYKKDYNKAIKNLDMAIITHNHYSTKNLFKGKLEEFCYIPENKSAYYILYLDQELSYLTINAIIKNQIDELDHMLVDKYIINQPYDKFIFDITNIPEIIIKKLTKHMDSLMDQINYIIDNNHLALWLINLNADS